MFKRPLNADGWNKLLYVKESVTVSLFLFPSDQEELSLLTCFQIVKTHK